ncbi:MAG: hypothetical protein IJI58_00635 [Bacilli bacterium]|nr:hypothetical protein [Bacilli bacterium]
MLDTEFAKTVVNDIRTYQIMEQNKNYYDRLYEAYLHIKEMGVESLEDFLTRKGLSIGAFNYYEVTIFDRITDKEYLEVLKHAMFTINACLDDYIKNPTIGDDLASWGKLGYTPKRDELIRSGDLVYGLTEEEKKRHHK